MALMGSARAAGEDSLGQNLINGKRNDSGRARAVRPMRLKLMLNLVKSERDVRKNQVVMFQLPK
jgi:hypothetical protein